jgi:sortase A
MESQATQDQALRELAEMSRRREAPSQHYTKKRAPPPPEGSPVGEIVIPNVGLSAAILEGTEPGTLRRAVGHVSGTAHPGEKGNICLAGHRDTFFRPLRKLSAGDEIQLRFPGGTLRYRVSDTETVDPHDVRVLDPSRASMLTLITCYPFYFIGPAPRRFIVRAKAISETVTAP